MKINKILKLIVAIGASLSAGAIGSFFTVSAIPVWYEGLVKPAVNPPSWIFGPVWTTLYVLMGIAAFLVWSSHAKATPAAPEPSGEGQDRQAQKRTKTALGVFGIQLILNATWSIVFFGLQSPGWALVNIALLWFAIAWTIVLFYKISKPAAYLLVPYILWVSFASYLNYAIWTLN